MCVYLSILYIYIYIYRERERENRNYGAGWVPGSDAPWGPMYCFRHTIKYYH